MPGVVALSAMPAEPVVVVFVVSFCLP